MSNARDIIVRPLVTEKTMAQENQNTVVFEVAKGTNKIQIKQAIEEVNEELSGNGRLLVRPSGTEPLIRVMAEAETDEICERVVNRVADIVRRKFGAEN